MPVTHAPLTSIDVIEVLRDPLVRRMKFHVGRITVAAAEYEKVADHIQTGDITVAPARSDPLYHPGPNTIELPGTSPPLDVSVRQNIIHECTHALIDINALDVTRLEGEVAAYLAEFTYLLMWINTGQFTGNRAKEMADTSGTTRTLQSIYQFAYTYNLHVPRGYGTVIDGHDIARMVSIIHADPTYARLGRSEKVSNRGVRTRPPLAP